MTSAGAEVARGAGTARRSTGRGTRPRCSRARTGGRSAPVPLGRRPGRFAPGSGRSRADRSRSPRPSADARRHHAERRRPGRRRGRSPTRLTAPANVTVEVVGRGGHRRGRPCSTAPGRQRASTRVDHRRRRLPDGAYTVIVAGANGDGPRRWSRRCRSSSAARSASSPQAPAAFSPNGDGRNDQLEVGVHAHRAGDRDRADRPRRPLGRDAVLGRELRRRRAAHRAGTARRSEGRLRDGTYEAVVEVDRRTGTASSSACPSSSDTRRPERADRPGLERCAFA